MCGRYGGTKHLGGYSDVLKMPFPKAMTVAAEINPMQMAPVIARGRDGTNTVVEARWSLIPSSFTGHVADWRASTTHARLEEIGEKPAFARAWQKRRRVIVPAACYWEWSDRLGRARTERRKWRIASADDEPLAIAGLWDHALTQEGPILSFTMLTRAPGVRMGRLHDREPVVLHAHEMKSWLDGENLDLTAPWEDDAFRLEAA